MRRDLLRAAWFAALLGAAVAERAVAEEPATPVEPSEWLNAPPGTSWAALKGRLILVEKWATW